MALSYRICEGRMECFVRLALSKDIFVLLWSHCCPNRQRPSNYCGGVGGNVCVYPEKASTIHLHLMSSQTFFDGTEDRKEQDGRSKVALWEGNLKRWEGDILYPSHLVLLTRCLVLPGPFIPTYITSLETFYFYFHVPHFVTSLGLSA